MNRIEAKESAKMQLKGKWGSAISAYLVATVALVAIGLLACIPFLGQIACFVLSGVMALGLAVYSLKFAKGKPVEIQEVFSGFNNIIKSFCVCFLIQFFTFLWSLLFIIPGIIKAISYSVSYYVLAENPEISAREAIKKSKELTHGHKWELFVTALSFIGWSIVSSLTLGIGYLWVVPYINITMANVYLQLKEDKEKEL